MSLWGNNDNLVSSGTVALNYDTGVVTGTGTTFGTAGFGVVGGWCGSQMNHWPIGRCLSHVAR